MDYAYMLGGGAPLVMKFACGDTHANAGVVTTAPDAAQAGVMISTTTAMVDAVGVTLDTATYVTAQQTDGTSAERLLSVLISPDACFRALMSGGATEGTAIAEFTVTAATTDGLDVIDTAVDWTSPATDEGGIYFTSGVNQGQVRKVITTGGAEATIATAFDNDHGVGDNVVKARVGLPWDFLDDCLDEPLAPHPHGALAHKEQERAIRLQGESADGISLIALLMVPRSGVIAEHARYIENMLHFLCQCI